MTVLFTDQIHIFFFCGSTNHESFVKTTSDSSKGDGGLSPPPPSLLARQGILI